MKKSDTRINHSTEDYFEIISVLRRLIKIILLELRTEVSDLKDIMFLYALARASTQIDSILQLWKLKHYSDCLIIYRTQVERLLTYHYLLDTNTIKDFDDWSLIQNFENRNRAKSDKAQSPYLTKKFWAESRIRIERYQRLKAQETTWKRPDSNTLEEIARKHDLEFFFKYGYKYASGFVHPLSSDGEHEFGLVTGIDPRSAEEYDTTPILNNSLIVFILIIELALNESSFEWNEYVFKVITDCTDYIKDRTGDYKETMKVVEYMVNTNFKIYKKYAT